MACEHNKRIGDNYGVSCQTCKKQLEGYGYGGFMGGSLTGDERCIHVWSGQYAGMEECDYCFEIREQVRERKKCQV